jgi:hypothetical protein
MIMLLFRNDRIVHVNVNWVTFTGHSAADCEGKTLSSQLFEGSESQGSSSMQHVAERLRNENIHSIDHDMHYLKFVWPYQASSRSSKSTTSSEAFSPLSSSSKFADSPSQTNPSPFCSDRRDSYKQNILPIPMRMYPVSIGSKHFAILCSI